MKIKGEFRDLIFKENMLIKDSGWRSNKIVSDYGRFLSALMKKDFTSNVGLDYIAVGKVASGDEEEFLELAKIYFDSFTGDPENPPYIVDPLDENSDWVWAKEIDPVDDIDYIDEAGAISATEATNTIQVEVSFAEDEPASSTFDFTNFALLGVEKESPYEFNKDKLFFINFVNHGSITKDEKMDFTRTIKLTFPIDITSP